MKPRSESVEAWDLRVTLKGTEPLVWRRLLVPANIRLDRLHLVLQAAMGWKNSHLHQFKLGDIIFCPPDPEEPFETDQVDERKARLDQVLPSGNYSFSYEYDFGDSWEHDVVLERIAQARTTELPACLGGDRACPPENSGGVTGYASLLAILANPQHPDHEEQRRWTGLKFDPAAFDLTTVNKRLRKIRS
jgi:hypothetical protein